MGWRFIERRYTGETYFNKYLFFLGLAILIYGLVSKYFGYASEYSTALTGGIICILGGFFPMLCAFILLFGAGLNIYVLMSHGYHLSDVPTGNWILSLVWFVIATTIAATSKHTGTGYEDIYEKTDY